MLIFFTDSSNYITFTRKTTINFIKKSYCYVKKNSTITTKKNYSLICNTKTHNNLPSITTLFLRRDCALDRNPSAHGHHYATLSSMKFVIKHMSTQDATRKTTNGACIMSSALRPYATAHHRTQFIAIHKHTAHYTHSPY